LYTGGVENLESNQLNEARFYEKLPKEKIRELRKEFYNTVFPKGKILWAVNIVVLLGSMTTAGFGMYYLIMMLFYSVAFAFVWYLFPLFFVATSVSLFLSFYNHNKYFRWLWSEKNILTKQWYPKEKQTTDDERIYKKLSKQEKKTLFKEFLAADSGSKKWMIFGFVLGTLMLVMAIILLIINLTQGHFVGTEAIVYYLGLYFTLLFMSFFFSVVYNRLMVYDKFFRWLGYEKNIKK